MEALKQGARLGPYELISPLGAGGMGEVWKARDTRLDRTVAIKFSKAAFGDRFQREARAIAALNHPNIATLHDVGDNYIVMEYVDGEPVRPPDHTRKLLDIAVQIADGLAAAHAAGFVHRDLKPDNILLTRQGRVKILDFGLAKQTAKPEQGEVTKTVVTDPGTVMGTVAYMSPEQARGQELDARSDQFSFGQILYELATGKRAFQRPTAAETMAAIIRENPEPLPPATPAPLRWVIGTCLEKDPVNRYDTTRGLYLELRRLRDHLTESAGVAPAIPKKSGRRWRMAAVALGVAAAGLLTGVALAPQAGPDLSRYRFTPFAVTDQNETTPVWSPDGRLIAYIIEEGTSMRIVVKSVGGGAPVTLVRGGSFFSLSWSADGERIYYQDRSNPPGFIAWVSRAGGEPRRLGPEFDGDKSGTPAMSPVADTLAVLAGEVVDGKRVRRVALSTPPGATPKPFGPTLPCCLTPPALVWAPDGTRIMVHLPEEDDRRHLWWISLDGQSREFRLDAQGMNAIVRPLSGGRYGVVNAVSRSAGDQGFRLFDLRNGSTSPFLPAATVHGDHAVSKDGTRLAYTTQTHGFGLMEAPLDGSPVRPLAPAKIDQHSVAWSPRANQFAFSTMDAEIIVRDREGTSEKVLLTGKDFPEAVSRPIFAWLVYSPDGSRILFACRGCEPGLSLWTVLAGGGAPARVARGNPDGGYGATFSPDGQWIAYNHTRLGQPTVLAKLRVGSGERPQPIHTSACRTPAWSPVADWIACNTRDALELVPSNGGQPRRLTGAVGALVWGHDGKSIYYFVRENGKAQLEQVNVATGARKIISVSDREYAAASPIAGARLSLSPDGKYVAGSVLVQDGDIWILDGFEPPKSFWERLWPWKR